MPCAVLVTGMPGSGKSLFTEAAKALGLPVLSMGDAVRREALKKGLEIKPDTIANIAKKLREEEGPEAVAKLTLELLPEVDVVVIEGVRSTREVEFFRRHFDNIIVIAVHSSPNTRFQRLVNRSRGDDPRNWVEFIERDKMELNFGIGEVIATADFMLINENISKEDFISLCLNLLRDLVKKICNN
ncbi:MAG: AAA family ATPase [Thermofilaceae archaeon]|nr:AAA family ATPase [Thermofilaceae archaeon]